MKPNSIETGNFSGGGGDLAAFWVEVLGVLYDEDLKLILKRCPQPNCPRCVAVRAEMKRRKRKGS
jgi:hypothetical protein